MSTTQDVFYVADMAAKLGRTEGAIRAAVNRARAAKKWPAWLPPIMAVKGSIQWHRPVVEQFLADRASIAPKGRKAKAVA